MRAENSIYFEELSWRGAGRSKRLGMICWKVLKEGRTALIDQRMPEVYAESSAGQLFLAVCPSFKTFQQIIPSHLLCPAPLYERASK